MIMWILPTDNIGAGWRTISSLGGTERKHNKQYASVKVNVRLLGARHLCFSPRLHLFCDRLVVVKGRPKNRTKPTRGLDLEEVRRRTSLLSGESRDPTPTPTTSRQAVAASRPATASSYFDAGWGRQHASPTPSPSEVPHPLHAAAVSDPVGAEGNYFNEEILRAREQGGRAGGRVIEQGPRGGDGLMDSAGSFLTTARSVINDANLARAPKVSIVAPYKSVRISV